MNEPNPVSRSARQKQPGGGKAASKTVLRLKHFNAHPPVWHPEFGWIGWLGTPDGPDAATILHEAMLDDWSAGIEEWSCLREFVVRLGPARLYRADPFFMQFWLSRIVEWHGYAIYSTAWKRVELFGRGTEFSRPHGQRIEPADAVRFREADREAEAAELAWTGRFP